MIPTFPQFKHVEVTDRADVEVFTHQFEPYSDFNFTSLWAWDTSNERMISVLNNNLVVRFTDYSTNEPFLSFLGTTKPNETAQTLLDYSTQNNLPPFLKLVPEISVKELDQTKFKIEEDRDNFDYICSVPEHGAFRGGIYVEKRRKVHKFLRDHPSATIKTLNLKDRHTREMLFDVLKVWEQNKISKKKEVDFANEFEALKRSFDMAASCSLLMTTGVYLLENLIAFSIDEILPNQYSICHFSKADGAYLGTYEFLMQQKSILLENHNVSLINYEQDLGIAGLRINKESYKAKKHLQKYTVSVHTP